MKSGLIQSALIMNLNSRTALNYAASLARPRRVGSGEDVKVADEIEDRLRRWGYRVERQPFTFSTAPNTFLTFVVLGGMLLVLVMLLAHEHTALLADAAAIVLIMLVVAFMPLNRAIQARSWRASATMPHSGRGEVSRPDQDHSPTVPGLARLLKHYTTANLIAQLPLPARSDVPHLYLVAHYDSKSQRMSLVGRITLFMLTIVLGFILAALTLLGVSSVLYYLIGLLALGTSLPLLFLDVGNNSPGAIDNASGVGLILHLAEVLSQHGDWRDKLRVTILVPSAEELTLMGSVAYVTAYERMLKQQAEQGGLYILNFDGIGVDGDLYYVGNSRHASNGATIGLLGYVQQACRELHWPLKRFGFAGALFDHIPFAQRGFDAISLIAVGKASGAIHTPGDSIEQLHVRGFEQAGQVALRVIEQLIQ